ncbi:radical SAM protein [Thermoleophilum album]|uniref:radical SAM protein n=1 Tax=Thermoleophilum album TaxID=29539 RepID=UPI00237D15A9|nr:radical SAM protein [Thermoleophilum album]
MRWRTLTTDRQPALPGLESAADFRHFDPPAAADVRFLEVRARSLLNRVPTRSRLPFRWTINPYRGCTHACVYCFARPSHRYLDLDPGRDFERRIVVKVNAPELARAELLRADWCREPVALGTNTDPYQWAEARYRLLPGIWEALRDSATPASLLTKSPLLLRDLRFFRELAAGPGFEAGLSIPTVDERAWRATEPHTPHPRARLEAVAELARNGIPTTVMVAPLMPGINDAPRQIEAVVEAAREAGATRVVGIPLHLRGELRDLFFAWLGEQRPELVARYTQLYARGAYLPRNERERLLRALAASRDRFRPPPRTRPSRSRERSRARSGRPTAAGSPLSRPDGAAVARANDGT